MISKNEKLINATVIAPICLILGCLFTASVSACEGALDYQNFVDQHYPSEITFDVMRNGKLVGQHTTRFSKSSAGLDVNSRMTLEIKVLFLTVFEFEYRSIATWCDNGLQRLEASTNRNGDETVVTAVAAGEGIEITTPSERYPAPAGILTTDHWNPAVLQRNEVLNTITGSVNNVEITLCESGTAIVEAAAPNAKCYEYRGELNTRVWYDSVGRWQGLEFEGDDGSTITYVCRRCI